MCKLFQGITMKTFLISFFLLIFVSNAADTDIYIILTGSVRVKYTDEFNQRKVREQFYTTSVIKMNGDRFKEEWATKSFKDALTKKRRDNIGVGAAKVQVFKDKKSAYAVYKVNTKKMDRMTFTKTPIEKLWKEEQKKNKK